MDTKHQTSHTSNPVVDTYKGKKMSHEPYFQKAIELARKEGYVNYDLLHKKLGYNYRLSSEIINQLEKEGMINPIDGLKSNQYTGQKQINENNTHLYKNKPNLNFMFGWASLAIFVYFLTYLVVNSYADNTKDLLQPLNWFEPKPSPTFTPIPTEIPSPIPTKRPTPVTQSLIT